MRRCFDIAGINMNDCANDGIELTVNKDFSNCKSISDSICI